MEKQELNNYLLDKQLRQEAMKRISGSFPFTDRMLSEHHRILDWKEVSGNGNIGWSVTMIERWEDYIDWTEFSRNADERILTPNIIERFKDKWDWKKLSSNKNVVFTSELIDKYIDRWDWGRLILRLFTHSYYENRSFTELSSKEFFERYHEHIPMDNFENSPLWEYLVDEEQTKIERQLVEENQLNGFQKTHRR
ncbi:MAG: hypothetical protein IKX51_09365 [Bacteroidales bacterium]|nr:hypothetical protein [Bacteroidales bacterium]